MSALKLLFDNKLINPFKVGAILVIFVLLTGGAFLGTKKFIKDQRELQASREALKVQKINEKVLDFTKLFIDQVLRAEKEIDFETRLKLENAARGINDKDILAQWEKFTASKTESEAQEQVKDLLDLLVSKIII